VKRSVLLAVIVSLGLHALLAVAFVWGGAFASGPEVRAELDLSSVELSFSEEVAETPPVPLAPPPSPEPKALPPKPVEPPPDIAPEKRLPPEPEAMRMREPEQMPVERMETPVVKHASEPPKAVPAPPAPAPRQARVDAPPRPKRAIRPEYPKGSRQRGEEGQVTLEIEVGSSGACTAVRVVTSSGFAELDEAAVRAARGARFTPAKSEGRSVASTARLTLDFKLK